MSSSADDAAHQLTWRAPGVAITVARVGEASPFRPNSASHHLWSMRSWRTGVPALTLKPAGSGDALERASPETEFTLVEFEAWYLKDAIGADALFERLDNHRDPKIEAFLSAIVASVRAERHRDAVVPAMTAALCRALAVTSGACAPRQDDAWINPNALRRVLTLVEDELGGNLRVDTLAATSGLSSSAFLRAFRGSMGSTPGDFVTARRIDRAELLLKGTDLPIARIARSCGFGSAAHFSTTFKARRGVQPSVLRRNIRLSTPGPSIRLKEADCGRR